MAHPPRPERLHVELGDPRWIRRRHRGRGAACGLSANNPYQQELLGDEQGKRLPTIYSDASDVRALAEFTEAERADARHGASAAQEAA